MSSLKLSAIVTVAAVVIAGILLWTNQPSFVDAAGLIVFFFLIPALFVWSASAPFLVIRKVMKKQFTVLNVFVALIVAGGLIALDIFLVYQGILWLAGAAFCDIYGC